MNIPSWTIFYDEREKHVNQMVFRLATKIFIPASTPSRSSISKE